MSEPLRGDVWLAEMDKRRPVVILTRNALLPRLSTILVAPITSRIRGIPTEVPLGAAQGLSKPCVANFDNISALSKRLLVHRIGSLSAADLRTVCIAARFAIQC